MDIALYEYTPTRSARVRWTLLELGLDFESIDGRPFIGSDELKKVHPMAKLPAAVIDGKPLFESAAICTYLADAHPEAGLVAGVGTWDRALHDQWVSFALTEIEAWLWVSARHTFILPEEERVPAIFEPNAREIRKGTEALDGALAGKDYLVGDRFSVTDVIVSYAVNWARRQGSTDGLANVDRYLKTLFEREHCTLDQSV